MLSCETMFNGFENVSYVQTCFHTWDYMDFYIHLFYIYLFYIGMLSRENISQTEIIFYTLIAVMFIVLSHSVVYMIIIRLLFYGEIFKPWLIKFSKHHTHINQCIT